MFNCWLDYFYETGVGTITKVRVPLIKDLVRNSSVGSNGHSNTV